MSTTLQRVLDELTKRSPSEQERIAQTWLAQLAPSPEPSGGREPYRVQAWDFGLPPGITDKQLKAIAYGEEESEGEGA